MGMIDREKVIKGLEIHTKPNSRCVGCPYPNNGLCGDQLYRDALALLKEQAEIVHCRDCKFAEDVYKTLPGEVFKCIRKKEYHAGCWVGADGIDKGEAVK